MSDATHEALDGLAILGDHGPTYPGVLGPIDRMAFGYVSDASATAHRTPWLVVQPDGRAIAYSGRVDFGQGARSGFGIGVANELRLPFDRVEVVLGDTDRVPWDKGSWGSQGTAKLGLQLRRAAATARQALLELASDRLDLPTEGLECRDGRVVSRSDASRSVSFEELLAGKQLEREVVDDIDLTPEAEFSIREAPAARPETVSAVTGQMVFARDVTLPGMLFAAVVRPPVYGATLLSVDSTVAEQMSGVVRVVRESVARFEEAGPYQGGDLVAVLAEDDEAAERAAAMVRVEWEEPPDSLSSSGLEDLLAQADHDQITVKEEGSIDDGLAAAGATLEARYFVPFASPVPIEPAAAVAQWEGDQLTVWAGTQGPFGIRGKLAQNFEIDEEQVRVIVPDGIGCAFGSKMVCPAAEEAATLARVAGRPVRVAYTRAEEMTWRALRMATLHDVKSGFDSDGRLLAWDFQTRHADRITLTGAQGILMPYDVPNMRLTAARTPLPSPIPTSFLYRAGAFPMNAFAREVHLDEIAEATGVDPLELRLRNMSDPRFRRVLEAAAERIGWQSGTSPTGRGQGIAIAFYAGTYIASAVQLEMQGSEAKVRRVVQAVDCGLVINAEGVAKQMEGAAMMALGTTLFEAIEFEGGRLLSSGFARYRVPRITDAPEVETVSVGDPDTPSTGVGEPPVIAVPAAISNALFDLTGERHRRLPIQRYLP